MLSHTHSEHTSELEFLAFEWIWFEKYSIRFKLLCMEFRNDSNASLFVLDFFSCLDWAMCVWLWLQNAIAFVCNRKNNNKQHRNLFTAIYISKRCIADYAIIWNFISRSNWLCAGLAYTNKPQTKTVVTCKIRTQCPKQQTNCI